MSDLMDNRSLDLVADLVLRIGEPFQRFLKNEDDIRGIVAVVGAPPVQGDAVIEAEQVPGRTKAHIRGDLRGRKVLDQDGHVFDPFAEFRRQAVDRFGDQFLETFPG